MAKTNVKNTAQRDANIKQRNEHFLYQQMLYDNSRSTDNNDDFDNAFHRVSKGRCICHGIANQLFDGKKICGAFIKPDTESDGIDECNILAEDF